MLFSTAVLILVWGMLAVSIILAVLKILPFSSVLCNIIVMPIVILGAELDFGITYNGWLVSMPAAIFAMLVAGATMFQKCDEEDPAEWALKRLSVSIYFQVCLVAYYCAFMVWTWIVGGNFGFFAAVLSQLSSLVIVLDNKFLSPVFMAAFLWIVCPVVYVFRAGKALAEGENGSKTMSKVLKVCAFIPVVNFFASWAGVLYIKLRHKKKLYRPALFSAFVVIGTALTAFAFTNKVIDVYKIGDMLEDGAYTVSDFFSGKEPTWQFDDEYVENELFKEELVEWLED